MSQEKLISIAEQMCEAWDRHWSNNDVEAFLALYTEDAVVESPLIAYLLNTEQGICYGKAELRRLIEIAIPRKPVIRTYYRNKCFTDGKAVIWEYPRLTPTGEQMDFIEVLEIQNGLIHPHRVYWGWRGIKVMQDDVYYR